MAKVLYITANPKPEELSYSLSVGKAFIDSYKKNHPQDEVVNIDVYKREIPLIDEITFSAWDKLGRGEKLSSDEQNKITAMQEILQEFMSADKYVFVTPLWNFTVPPKMKAYIDNICVAGQTFKYTENGPVGLLKGKKAVHIQARGGFYSSAPAMEVEMGDRYMHAIFNFIGITDNQSIIIEGVNFAPDKAQEFKDNAIKRAEEISKSF